MRRLPAAAFALLAVATVGAFFLAQHLKVANPFVFNNAVTIPAAFNPARGRVCVSSKGKPLSYRKTLLSFSVGHTDSVGVYVVNASDTQAGAVATITSGTQMKAGYYHLHTFSWNGHLSDGHLAPQGSYLFRIVLNGEGTTVDLNQLPVQVVSGFPHPRVLSVRASGVRSAAPSVLSPPQGQVKIHFTAGVGQNGPPRRVWLDVYRTDLPGGPRLVDQIVVKPKRTTAGWNGEINGRPAPAGIYRVGITAQDAACDQVSNHAATVGTGVTVRYLAVTPPLAPVTAGTDATVAVDSPLAGFTWKLRRAGTTKVLARGSGPAGQSQLAVRLPARRAGLYTLTVREAGTAFQGPNLAAVPLVASATGRAGTRARVLVVLPMLSWIGQSRVDDTGDGAPTTLSAGDSVPLDRPLVFSAGATSPPDLTRTLIGDDVSLLDYLNAQHYRYQLTTDVALAEGVGPSLTDRWGVLLPDGSTYLPGALRPLLSGFVRAGGRALVLGTGAQAGSSTIGGYPTDPQASAPKLSSTDLFGAQRGPVTSTDGALIVELKDGLHLFGLLTALTGFSSYQPIEPPAAAGVSFSAAGIASNQAPAVTAFAVGSGTAIEVGLPDFGASLASNVDAQELLDSVWPLLAKLG